MSLTKLYERIIWANNTSPALNDTNLNKMSKGLDDIDNRVISLAGTIMEDVPQIQQDLEQAAALVDQMEEMTANPPYIGANGNWYVWNTNTGAYVDSGVDAGPTISIGTVTSLAPGSTPTVTNSGTQTDAIFNFGIPQGATGAPGADGDDGKSAYEQAVEGGYTGTEAQFEDALSNFQTYAQTASNGALNASASAGDAAADALKSEGFAVGKQSGTAVGPASPYYQNNAQYFAALCAQYAQSFSGLKFMGSISYLSIPTTGMTNGDMYDINEAFVTDNRFEEGSGIACAAGTDIVWVESDNKWNILTPSGVYSFNGRQGAISPASGDYDASQITYNTSSTVDAALGTKISDNPTFSEASTRANIASGESFATILGKIKKYFTDLASVAFSGAYSDLTGTPTIPSVSTDYSGTASASGTRVQRIGINSVYTEIDGTKYMEATSYTTSGSERYFSFTNADITSSAVFDVYCDQPLKAPTQMVLSGNNMKVYFASADSVTKCRLYIR